MAARYEPWRLDSGRPYVFNEHHLSAEPILDTHRHDELEVGICCEGGAKFVIGEKTFTCSAGDVVVIGPREDHRACAETEPGSQWWFLHLDLPLLLDGVADPEGVAKAADLAGPEFPNRLEPGSRAARAAALLVEAARDRSPAWLSEMRGLTLALLAAVRRLPGRSPTAGEHAMARHLAPALRLMSANYRHALDIPSLARACSMGETTFRRSFVTSFGHGPKEHLILLRLSHALTRLHAGDAVAEAAEAAGFSSLRVFHRHFRQRYGCAPRTWLGQKGA